VPFGQGVGEFDQHLFSPAISLRGHELYDPHPLVVAGFARQGRPAGDLPPPLHPCQAGSATTTVVPWPGVLLMSMRPPCSSMILTDIARPRPVPPLLVVT